MVNFFNFSYPLSSPILIYPPYLSPYPPFPPILPIYLPILTYHPLSSPIITYHLSYLSSPILPILTYLFPIAINFFYEGRNTCYSLLSMLMVNKKWKSFLYKKSQEWWPLKFKVSFGLYEVCLTSYLYIFDFYVFMF